MLEDEPGMRSSAKPATARGSRARLPAQAARRRNGLRLAGNQRARGDPTDSAETPDTAVLMLSMHSEETLVRQALDAGARGYILKSAMDLELVNAVKRVAAGETVLDPALDRPAR